MHEDDVAVYDRELVSRLEALLVPSLVGVHAASSRALGDGVPGRSDLDRLVEPSDGFVIDRAIVRGRDLALAGPPPAEVFGEIPRETVLAALRESLA